MALVAHRVLGVYAPTEERNKPPCCTDGEPPVDAALVQRIVTDAKRLRRG